MNGERRSVKGNRDTEVNGRVRTEGLNLEDGDV